MTLSENPEATVTVTLTVPVSQLLDLAQEADQAADSYSRGGTTDSEIDLADLVLRPITSALYAAANAHR